MISQLYDREVSIVRQKVSKAAVRLSMDMAELGKLSEKKAWRFGRCCGEG